MTADRTVLPPVQLPSEAQLARQALAAPLFARAVRLARWARPGLRVGAAGELLDAELRLAAGELGLQSEEEGRAAAGEAWRIAVDIGLVEVAEQTGDEDAGDGDDAALGSASPSADLELVTQGSPADVLELWSAAGEAVLADAALPDMSDLVEQITAGGELDLDDVHWDPEADADFLDGALSNLYLLTAVEGGDAEGAVPLPALAASLVVPEDMEEPTDEVLAEVSEAVLRLDEQFRMLEPVGLVEYQPVAEEILQEAAGGAAADGPEPQDADISRYGAVRLTPLGLYGLRQRMVEDGLEAPVVGELADEDAYVLLEALPRLTDAVAQRQASAWLEDRKPAEAVAELLAAARGGDVRAPVRRLACQQALAMVGHEAEPAVRDVLHDRELGGLARVWLAERGAGEVPQPSEDMVFWLAVDTIAAQLGGPYDESPELRELMEGLVGQHRDFFSAAWRVDHPATPEVLEAMGRLHPDRQVAKEARKAAFKARSR